MPSFQNAYQNTSSSFNFLQERIMAIKLNHTIVHSIDREAADFLTVTRGGAPALASAANAAPKGCRLNKQYVTRANEG
jgi:hypothetical protein